MSHADTAPPPVFVGGTGCSGSTVVGRLIGEHPSFAFIPHQVRFHAEPWGLPGLLLDRVDIADFAARMRAAWFEQTPRGRQGHLQRVVDEATLEAALIRFERGFGDDRLATSRQLVHDLLDPIAAAEGKPGWVEMTPRNVFHAAALLELFPDAKIIHAVRDGCDTASYLTAKGWVADMDEGLQWWAHRYAQALRSLRGIPEESLFVLALESLVDERREESYGPSSTRR